MYVLNKRQIEIITYLLNENEYISAKSISNQFKVSVRTIRYDIEIIEDWLEQNDAILIKLPSKGMTIKSNLSKEVLFERLKLISLENRILSEKERVMYAILELLSQENELTIADLSNRLLLSKNTIMKVVIEVKQFLLENNLKLEKIPAKGFKIAGDEFKKRELLVKLFAEIFGTNNIILALHDEKVFKEFVEYCENNYPKFNFNSIKYIFEEIKAIEKEYNFNLTDEALAKFILYLMITIYRMKQQNYITIGNKSVRGVDEHNIGTRIAYKLSKTYSISFIEEEIEEITNRILEANVFNISGINGKGVVFSEEVVNITKNIIIYSENELKVKMIQDEELFQTLAMHIKSALVRIKNNKQITNLYRDEIINRFPIVYQTVKDSLTQFHHDYIFNDDEIAHITLHIRAGYERNYNVNHMYTALVICQEGVSILELLAVKLQLIVPELKIIKTCSITDYYNNKKEIDLIITTNNFRAKDVDVIKVSPFLENDDIYNIRNTLIKLNKFKQIYKYNRVDRAKEGKVILLEDLLTLDMIELGVKADDWEDAIRKAAIPLVKYNKVENDYVQNMIKAVHDLGPYIVIMPGIAFAHARPDKTVKETCMSMITLDPPINFGSEPNDPISIVFAFGAENGNDHLKALQDLAKFLMLEENVEFLKNAEDKSTVFEKLIYRG